jgi:hypothetical protein
MDLLYKAACPLTSAKKRFKLARLGAVRWVTAEREDGSEGWVTLSKYPLVEKA